jgi:hypothetical protein
VIAVACCCVPSAGARARWSGCIAWKAMLVGLADALAAVPVVTGAALSVLADALGCVRSRWV